MIHGTGERPHTSENLRVAEPNVVGLHGTHGKAGDGAAPLIRNHPVMTLNVGNAAAKKRIFKTGVHNILTLIFRIADHSVVHDDQKRTAFPSGNQVIQNEVYPAGADPGSLVFGAAVL